MTDDDGRVNTNVRPLPPMERAGLDHRDGPLFDASAPDEASAQGAAEGRCGVRLLLSLDYELYFGDRAGTVARTLIEPTNELLRIANRSGVKMAFFVDSGFLLRLAEGASRSRQLAADLRAVRRQLDELHRLGHDLQLHIHSHWEDSYWNGDRWVIDTRRYRLHDFSPTEISDIVHRYKAALTEFSGNARVFAFRAGGWVIQPFDRIRDALRANGIYVDSTVFPGGVSDSPTHFFDFRSAPEKSSWRFDQDPLQEDQLGYFLEVPIASRRLSPMFFWKLAFAKKFGGAVHQTYGDGSAIPLAKRDLVAKLLRPTQSVVSMDGYKASFLLDAYHDYKQAGKEYFVVIGHPKSLTRHSLEMLSRFCAEVADESCITYRHFER